MVAPAQRTSRASKRAETEARVLQSARVLFGRDGYDRATIRAIASSAGVDPSLVMQYFGSKDELFARVAAARWDVEAVDLAGGSREDLVDQLLALFAGRAGDDEELSSVKALLRSSLTNADAAAATRKVLFEGAAQRLLSPAVDGPDAALRAELVAAMLLGVVVARSFLEVEPLASTPMETLRPYLRDALLTVLVTPNATPAPVERKRTSRAGKR